MRKQGVRLFEFCTEMLGLHHSVVVVVVVYFKNAVRTFIDNSQNERIACKLLFTNSVYMSIQSVLKRLNFYYIVCVSSFVFFVEKTKN